MHPQHTTAEPIVQPGRMAPTIRGRHFIVARGVGLALLALAAGLVGITVPLRLAQLRTICTVGPCDSWQLSIEGLRALQEHGLSLGFYAAFTTALDVVHVSVYLLLALLLVWRKAEERMPLFVALMFLGWALLVFPLDTLAAFWPAWAGIAAANHSLAGVVFTVLFAYLFPDGRFVPRWTRWLALAVITWQALGIVFPASLFDWQSWLPQLDVLAMAVLVPTLLFAQVYRYRHVSGPVQRQQTKWVMFSLVALLVVTVLVNLLQLFPTFQPHGSPPHLALRTILYGFRLFLPLSIGMAMLRYRLWDIDPLINRTLVYGALTASVIGIYVLVVGYLGTLFQASNNLVISLTATSIVAVMFQPLRDRLQRLINRCMYGDRDDPYAVLARLDQRLEATIAPDAILPTIVETVAGALKLPYVAITLRQDERFVVAAAHGRPLEPLLRLPLFYQNTLVGELLLAERAPGESFSTADHHLLEDVARHAGVVAHGVVLTAELQRSRERLVTAREEERRRIRRDLHDGLGPQLASLTLTIAAARELLVHDPRATDALLQELGRHAQAAIVDIRRVIYGLRPPALDDLGLMSALREQAAQASRNGVQVGIDAPDCLPPLPAAVEVAAYRIVTEALTNVVRHAEARTCIIRLVMDGVLIMEIRDDGRGVPADCRAGVGFHSMRERAEELGGTCKIESVPGGGTRVYAWLPVAEEG